MWRQGLFAGALAALLFPISATAQQLGLSGYYLNVGTHVAGSLLGPAGVSDVQRLRVMLNASPGPLRLDAAYEHTLSLRQAGAAGAQLFTATGTESGGDWFSLGGELDSGERTLGGHRVDMVWRHRVDRLSVRVDLGSSADLIVGRQPISWATTLFLSPADPFSPFDPADPFREYRAGVDAARLRIYRGAFTQFEVVARPARLGERETLTVLGRASSNHQGWDFGVWGGSLHGTFGGAAFLSGSVGLWALRAEGVLRAVDKRAVARGAIGVDRTFAIAGRDLYVVIEVQRDGFGATSPDELLAVAGSRPFGQGEMQVLGRAVGAVQLSWTLHPLVSASGLLLGSFHDRSFIASPGVSWSVSESVAVRGGVYLGVGEGAAVRGTEVRIGSEFGALPRVMFGSLNWFF
ncbi:MAG: hypothetical protein F4X60_06935 [Gemmatimonadetes bacterium]|nr:hypothetical protein [Gemmatimonadota bacterium]